MTTAHSPLHVLKTQAAYMARTLKAVARGETVIEDRGGKLALARLQDTVTFAVAMDDKILKIEMGWKTIQESSEAGLAEYIVKQMREARDGVQ